LEQISLLRRMGDGAHCGESRNIAVQKLIAMREKSRTREVALARLIGESAQAGKHLLFDSACINAIERLLSLALLNGHSVNKP
jgi:hypothetical protein